jgi:hypothetical protein
VRLKFRPLMKTSIAFRVSKLDITVQEQSGPICFIRVLSSFSRRRSRLLLLRDGESLD